MLTVRQFCLASRHECSPNDSYKRTRSKTGNHKRDSNLISFLGGCLVTPKQILSFQWHVRFSKISDKYIDKINVYYLLIAVNRS